MILCAGEIDLGSCNPLTPRDFFLPVGGFLRIFLFLAKSLGEGLINLAEPNKSHAPKLLSKTRGKAGTEEHDVKSEVTICQEKDVIIEKFEKERSKDISSI